MQKNIQILAIGELEEGKNQTTGRAYTRRRFQCFDMDEQIVGTHVVYAPKEELLAYTERGHYIATITTQTGDRGEFDFRITKLTLNIKPKASA